MERDGEIGVGLDIVRLQIQRLAKLRCRLLRTAQKRERAAEVVMRLGPTGLKEERAVIMSHRVLGLVLGHQRIAEIEMGCRVVWHDGYGARKLRRRLGEPATL